MTSPAELERKVRQLDNDTQSIYELLAAIQATQRRHGNRLDELGTHLDELGSQLDGIATSQTEQDTKLDTILRLLQPDDN